MIAIEWSIRIVHANPPMDIAQLARPLQYSVVIADQKEQFHEKQYGNNG
jgi:hypothetical protein